MLQECERETYYVQRGMIVFTISQGLCSTAPDHKQRKQIKDPNRLPHFATHYLPPLDRDADMREAYGFFADRL